MAQYLISVWHDDEYDIDFDSGDAQRIGAQVGAFNEEITAAGAWVFGGGLQPASSATVVRSSGEGSATTAGPYAGGPAQMGGFWVLEADDSDAAMVWAAKAAAAAEGPIELRPFQVG
ncbi:MAG: YciI family protein [Acidimicrobiales bacterium]